MELKVIDSHVHFPAFDFMGDGKSMGGLDLKGNEWVDWDKAKWRLAWRFPDSIDPVTEEDEEETTEKWYEEVKKSNIEKIIFVTAGGNEKAYKILKNIRINLLCMLIMHRIMQILRKNLKSV